MITMMQLRRSSRCSLLLLLSLSILLLQNCCLAKQRRKDGNPLARSIIVQNEAKVKIDFFWVHSNTGELADSTTDGGIVHGADTSISSYVGHTFEVQELPKKKTGKCVYEECRAVRFTVSSNEDQVFIVHEDFDIEIEDHKTKARKKARESLEECKAQLVETLKPEEQIEKLAACMEESLTKSMRDSVEDIEFQAGLRKHIGTTWADYVCKDDNITSTPSFTNETWTYVDPAIKRKQNHRVNILFDSSYNAIERVNNFITFEECDALRQAATTNEATGKLGLPLAARTKKSLVNKVMDKIEYLATSVSGLAAVIQKDPLMDVRIDQADAAASEDCTIESDGTSTCANQAALAPPERILLNYPNIVTTIILVCQAPTKGGQIYFPKSGTVLLPKDSMGSAIVLVHEKEREREKDPFVNEYVICPVKEGTLFTVYENMGT